MTLHTISVLVENKFGVLARVAGMFSGRGYNIHTLNVGPSHDPRISRMTIVVREKENVLNQIIRQLDKLIDVIQVLDFREGDYVDRELVLLQVKVDRQTRAEVIEICQLFRAKIIDVAHRAVTIEITGDSGKIDKFVALMDSFGILELTRTGRIALPRVSNETPEKPEWQGPASTDY
jgi:acetolactate synthase I/III small subunit